jgi:hypothetical protein
LGTNKDKVIFFLPDQHYAPSGDENGGVDPGAEAVALKALQLIKPDAFYNLGDAGEWTSVSHWQWSRRKRPPLEYQIPLIETDVAAVNAGLDKWDCVLDKINCEERVFTCGNHDQWLNNFVEEYPYMDKYTPERAMRLQERGYEYHPYGEYVEVTPDLFTYHGGHRTSANHVRDHLSLGKSLIYAHHHSAECAAGATLDGPILVWCMACICKLSKPFLKGKLTNWSHGFGVVTVHNDGAFQVEFVPIVGGVSNVWGRKVVA